jgi:hypothetical protein
MIADYTACCGASIIYSFFYDPSGVAEYETEPVNGRLVFKRDPSTNKMIPKLTYEQKFHNILDDKIKEFGKGGRMFSCILNAAQCRQYSGAWPRILKSRGFEFVRRWTNANHGDPEFLYLFVLCTDAKNKCKGDFAVPPEGWDSIEVVPYSKPEPAKSTKPVKTTTVRAAGAGLFAPMPQ